MRTNLFLTLTFVLSALLCLPSQAQSASGSGQQKPWDDPLLASHICGSTEAASQPTCEPDPLTDKDLTNGGYWGARSDPGEAFGAIDVWGYCRYIDNISPSTKSVSIFVPFRSKLEWTAFIKNAPADVVNLVHCAREEKKIIRPDPQGKCVSPAPEAYEVVLPYARYYDDQNNSKEIRMVEFQCTDQKTGRRWTEIATAFYEALDSDMFQANKEYWKLTNLYYDEALWKN